MINSANCLLFAKKRRSGGDRDEDRTHFHVSFDNISVFHLETVFKKSRLNEKKVVFDIFFKNYRTFCPENSDLRYSCTTLINGKDQSPVKWTEHRRSTAYLGKLFCFKRVCYAYHWSMVCLFVAVDRLGRSLTSLVSRSMVPRIVSCHKQGQHFKLFSCSHLSIFLRIWYFFLRF